MSAHSFEHHVPRYHVRPERGYLNDPNGPVIVDGVLHLYFQYRLTTDTDEPVMWGHATSRDYARWWIHRPAMAPTPAGLDRDGCWSGNTLLAPDGTVRAFYSGLRAPHPYQSVLGAVSTDGGASFGTPTQLVQDPEYPARTFRDPFVWRDGGGWAMVVGAGDADEVASLRLYRSPDLSTWQFDRVIAELPRMMLDGVDTGAMWECPQILSFNDTSIALIGSWAHAVGTMRVLVVEVDLTGRARPVLLHPLDDGPDFYAASVLRESPYGPLVWGWVTEARDPSCWKAAGWAGAISLPRVVALRDGRLRSVPLPALAGLRLGVADCVVDGSSRLIAAQSEVFVRANAGENAIVRIQFGELEWLELCMEGATGAIVVDRSNASLDPGTASDPVTITGAADEMGFEVRVFVDGSVFEIFASTGRVATLRCYPTAPPPWTVGLTGKAELTVWGLRGFGTADGLGADAIEATAND